LVKYSELLRRNWRQINTASWTLQTTYMQKEEENSLSTFICYTSQSTVIYDPCEAAKLKPNSNSSVGHPAGMRADAPHEARVCAVPGERDDVLARARRVAASRLGPDVRQRRRACLGANRPRCPGSLAAACPRPWRPLAYDCCRPSSLPTGSFLLHRQRCRCPFRTAFPCSCSCSAATLVERA
jgi:hypothetical protein